MGRTIAGVGVEKKEEVGWVEKFAEGPCHVTWQEIASAQTG
jgi:hypothetical protein